MDGRRVCWVQLVPVSDYGMHLTTFTSCHELMHVPVQSRSPILLLQLLERGPCSAMSGPRTLLICHQQCLLLFFPRHHPEWNVVSPLWLFPYAFVPYEEPIRFLPDLVSLFYCPIVHAASNVIVLRNPPIWSHSPSYLPSSNSLSAGVLLSLIVT